MSCRTCLLVGFYPSPAPDPSCLSLAIPVRVRERESVKHEGPILGTHLTRGHWQWCCTGARGPFHEGLSTEE